MSILLDAAKSLVGITQQRDAYSKECGRLNGELARVMRERDEAIALLREFDDALTEWFGLPENIPPGNHADYERWTRLIDMLSRAGGRP